MTDNCHHCSSAIKTNERSLTCVDCSNKYHLKCANINTSQFNTVKNKWSCVLCLNKNNSAENGSVNLKDILLHLQANTSELREFKKVVTNQMSTIQESLDEVRKSQEFISKQYDEIKIKFDKLIKDFDGLNKAVSENSLYTKKLETELEELRRRTNKLEQEQLANSLIITGVKEDKNEDLKGIFMNLMDHLKLPGLKTTFMNAYRLKSGPIIVDLIHKSFRNMILNAKKGKKLNNHDIGLTNQSKKEFFVNERSTSETIAIYKKARELKELGFKFIWTKFGSVFIKKNEKCQPRKFESLDEIEKFVNIVSNSSDASEGESGSPNNRKRSRNVE